MRVEVCGDTCINLRIVAEGIEPDNALRHGNRIRDLTEFAQEGTAAGSCSRSAAGSVSELGLASARQFLRRVSCDAALGRTTNRDSGKDRDKLIDICDARGFL